MVESLALWVHNIKFRSDLGFMASLTQPIPVFCDWQQRSSVLTNLREEAKALLTGNTRQRSR